MPAHLTTHDYEAAASALGCSVAAVRAVAEVESGSLGGFLKDGSPVILFEPHIFHRLTGGRFADKSVAIGPDRWRLSYPKWKGQPYGSSGIQHAKLEAAARLSRADALQACSWGRFQIMGFNWQACGFPDLQAFINAMYAGEQAQLMAFVAFCKSKGLGPALARCDWRTVARLYNGPGQVDVYAPRLAFAYKKHAS